MITTDTDYIDNEAARALTPEQKAIWDETFVCFDEIREILAEADEYRKMVSDPEITVAAYLLSKISEYSDPASMDFDGLYSLNIRNDVMDAARRYHMERGWEKLRMLTEVHPQNVFRLAANLTDLNDKSRMPEGIVKLAAGLLGVRREDRVADFCCGSGSFGEYITETVPELRTVGYETDRDTVVMENIREELSGKRTHIENRDVFSVAAENVKFDRIFANYPLGQNLRDLGYGKEYLESLKERIPGIMKATSADWLYNMLLIDTLSADGKAVGIMTCGGTRNRTNAKVRQYFVENGLVECVITLPPRILPGTGIPTAMIVLSHGNERIRLVDASERYRAGRRVNELSGTDVEAILEAAREDGEISLTVTEEELREKDYVLDFGRYRNDSEKIENGVPFESVIRRITRGAPLTAKELDGISSEDPTDMQYLMLANIQNGIISDRLPYLSEIGKKNEKYCLKNHSLIISKNGRPYKVAVAEVPSGKKIMANGNLYVIEPDEEKADPYYLAAYFGSENGTAALERITVGASIPNIGVEPLKKLIIPLPDLEHQRKVVERYRAAKEEIAVLQEKLEKARQRLADIFAEEES